MRAGRRRSVLARYVAPAAFLLAVTIAALLIRQGLGTSRPAAETRTVSTVAKTVSRPRTRPRAAPKRYYVIRSGDTLELIAIRFDTSVTALMRLNPGIEPTALTPGERVRIR